MTVIHAAPVFMLLVVLFRTWQQFLLSFVSVYVPLFSSLFYLAYISFRKWKFVLSCQNRSKCSRFELRCLDKPTVSKDICLFVHHVCILFRCIHACWLYNKLLLLVGQVSHLCTFKYGDHSQLFDFIFCRCWDRRWWRVYFLFSHPYRVTSCLDITVAIILE